VIVFFSDSWPLIALSKINNLDILRKFFDKIIIPEAVWTEVVEKGEVRPIRHRLREKPYDRTRITQMTRMRADPCKSVRSVLSVFSV